MSTAAGPAPSRRRPTLSWPSTARGWTGLLFAALVLLVAAWWVRGWLSGPPPPFPPASGDRMVAAAGAGWPTVSGGLDGARRTTVEVSLGGSAGWAWSASSPPSTTLVTDGESAYVGLDEGVIVALAVATGEERWRADVPGVLESAPAVAGDRLYVGYRSGSVAALSSASGETLWETQLGVSVSTTPAVVDGLVFAAGNGVIGGFDAEDGAMIWRRELSDTLVPASPVVDGETLVIAAFDRVLIFDRANGHLLSWANLAPQHAPIASLAIDDGVIYVTADQQLLAISTSMRRPWWDGVRPVWDFFHVVGAAPEPPWRPDVWSTSIPHGSFPAAVDREQVFVASESGVLRALSRVDGRVNWQVDVASITAPPVVTASGLLVAGDGRAWLVEPANGSVVAEGLLSDAPLNVVPVESGSFVVTMAGVVRVLSTSADRPE